VRVLTIVCQWCHVIVLENKFCNAEHLWQWKSVAYTVQDSLISHRYNVLPLFIANDVLDSLISHRYNALPLFIANDVLDSLISHRYNALPLFIANDVLDSLTSHCCIGLYLLLTVHEEILFLKPNIVILWSVSMLPSDVSKDHGQHFTTCWWHLVQIYQTCTKMAVDFLLDCTFPVCVYIACKQLRSRHWIVRSVCEIWYSDTSAAESSSLLGRDAVSLGGRFSVCSERCRAFVFVVMQSKTKCWHRWWKLGIYLEHS